MFRHSRFLPGFAAALLSGCTMTVAPLETNNASAAPDCQGPGGSCSVAAHEARQPVMAADIDTHIHDYLVAHPEVIQEAQIAGQKRLADARLAGAKKALAENRDAVFNDPADPVLGNPRGDVTIVAFTDYECPFCKRITPAIDELVKADAGVRVVLKEFPILGPMSETAARYALAAARQGKYAAFHAALMASTIGEHQLTEVQILGFAAAVGLDAARLARDAAEPAIQARIAGNRALAQSLAITGTPGLIVGDRIQSGLITAESLKKAVADARARKVAMLP